MSRSRIPEDKNQDDPDATDRFQRTGVQGRGLNCHVRKFRLGSVPSASLLAAPETVTCSCQQLWFRGHDQVRM